MNDMEPLNERIMNLMNELWYEEQIEEIERKASELEITVDYYMAEFM
jgi:hypothetical protein